MMTLFLQVVVAILEIGLAALATFGQHPGTSGLSAPRTTRFFWVAQSVFEPSVKMPRIARWIWGAFGLLSAFGLVVSIWVPFFAFFAACLAALLLLSALVVALQQKASHRSLLLIAITLVGAVAIIFLQPLGLKVLALPKADPLPLQLTTSAKVLKTYEAGMWFEGIAIGADGTIYMSESKGENLLTGDKSLVEAEIITRAPNGAEHVFFKLPRGSTAGVLAFDEKGALYMTSTGTIPGVWKIEPNGHGALLAHFPLGAWPNGLAIGPDSKIYVADSSLGTIWRVDATSGEVRKALESDMLRARKFIALAPGANGLHFFGSDMLVTVSDAGTVLRIHLSPTGDLEEPAVAASGIPADDFAIDRQGNIYLTTHPYNTVVRVGVDGHRMVIAGAIQGVIGATDAAFGTLPGDRDTLYVVTDGGAFSSGDRDARGALIALRVPTDH